MLFNVIKIFHRVFIDLKITVIMGENDDECETEVVPIFVYLN